MAKLNIVKEGDDILRKISRPVTEITPRIHTLLDDMVETMRDANGCGLVLHAVITDCLDLRPSSILSKQGVVYFRKNMIDFHNVSPLVIS